jgi:hypothetical protein
MAIHKLDIDEFDEIDYCLIAIHTSLEDFRLAYFINQHLPINLSKSKDEIHINVKVGETYFSRFYFYDEEKCTSWNLIQNKNEVIGREKRIKQDLFSNSAQETITRVFLLPELRKVDYFLKIGYNTRIFSDIEDTIRKPYDNKYWNITTVIFENNGIN